MNTAALPGLRGVERAWKDWLKRVRKSLRTRLSLLIAQRYGTPLAQPDALAAPPQRILLCRLNGRLGNALFLTPLIESLGRTFPNAAIDVVVLGRTNATLLAGHPHVRRAWAAATHPLIHMFTSLRLIHQIRQQRYDLVIDPIPNSTSNRLGVLLSGARARLGFAGPDQWLALDYAAPRDDDVPHQALKALGLLSQGFTNVEPVLAAHYSLAYSDAAQAAASEHWRELQAQLGPDAAARPLIGFFAQATAAKQLPLEWWQAWLEAMQKHPRNPLVIQVLPPQDGAPISGAIPYLRIAAANELAATLARLNGFVCADTGPMHLAAAAGVPTVGLFNTTNPAHYRPLGPHCVALANEQLEPAYVAEQCLHN